MDSARLRLAARARRAAAGRRCRRSVSPRRCAGLAVALVLGFSLDAGAADLWVRDGSGQCVKSWSPSSLARGPRAMLGALLLPFRSLAGSFTDGAVAAVLSPFSLVVGLAEAGSWFIAGALDTATAGSLRLARVRLGEEGGVEAGLDRALRLELVDPGDLLVGKPPVLLGQLARFAARLDEHVGVAAGEQPDPLGGADD